MTVRIVTPTEGDILGDPDGVRDRFLIAGADSDSRFALVEHLMAPGALAAPVHRHSREDEYSFVLEGAVGIMLGEQEITARTGDLVFKPRAQWHTFWNAGDEPARLLEIISPGGLEALFRALDTAVEEIDEARLLEMAGEYGCDLDFARTGELLERHALHM